MRLLTLFLVLWSVTTMAGLPPTTVQNDQTTTKTGTFNFIVPNKQATLVNGGTRIATGNTNLLENASFEAASFNAAWGSPALGSATLDTVNVVDGKQSIKIVSTGAGVRMVQASTINAASLKGQQMVARVSINSTDSALQACALVDGTSSAQDTNCITVPVTTTDSPFKTVEIPFIAGGVSNGIVIKSATTTTQQIYIDDAFVGKMAPFQGVSGAKLVGAVKITNCATPWTLTSTSYASFTAQTGCVYTTYGQAVADTSFGPTQLPSIKFATLPPGDYSIQYEGGTEMGTSNVVTQFRFTDGTNTSREETTLYSNTAVLFGGTLNHSISYSTTQTNVTLQIQGKSPSSTVSVDGTASRPGVIKVYYFPPESKIYSQASQDTGWQSFTPTSSNNSLSFTSPSMFWKRQGGDLLIMGSATVNAGASGASEARMDFPSAVSGTTLSTVLANTTVGISTVGANTASNYYAMIKPSVSYISFSAQNSGSNAQTLLSGTAYNSAGIHSFQMRIPIQGWQDYGVIVGSFAGIEKCANDYECTDTFSAQVSSAGVVSGENLDWINGNAVFSPTGTATITLNTNLKDGTSGLTSPMNCVATNNESGSNALFANIKSSSTSSIAVYTNITSGTSTNYGFNIKCQKGTNDYKPKTAKVATSIGVPTVPGITTAGTGNAIDTFSLSYGGATATTVCSSSPCTIYNQIGTAVSSVTFPGTGTYVLNFTKTYSAVNCVFNAQRTVFMYPATCSGSCSSLTLSTENSSLAGTNSYGTVYCQGKY